MVTLAAMAIILPIILTVLNSVKGIQSELNQSPANQTSSGTSSTASSNESAGAQLRNWLIQQASSGPYAPSTVQSQVWGNQQQPQTQQIIQQQPATTQQPSYAISPPAPISVNAPHAAPIPTPSLNPLPSTGGITYVS